MTSASLSLYFGLLKYVSAKTFLSLTQQGLKVAYVNPPPTTPPTNGIAFLKNPAKMAG